MDIFWEASSFNSLPFSVTSIVLTRELVKKGMLAPHPRFGVLPKCAAAALCGYILGKISYMRNCRMKILKLENSPLGEYYRAQLSKRGMMPQDQSRVVYSQEHIPNQQEMSAPLKEENYESDIDTERKLIKGLDDRQRPNVDTMGEGTQLPSLGQGQHKPYTSYDDLRRANRAEVRAKRDAMADYGQATTGVSTVVPKERPVDRAKRNKYGDIVEE